MLVTVATDGGGCWHALPISPGEERMWSGLVVQLLYGCASAVSHEKHLRHGMPAALPRVQLTSCVAGGAGAWACFRPSWLREIATLVRTDSPAAAP